MEARSIPARAWRIALLAASLTLTGCSASDTKLPPTKSGTDAAAVTRRALDAPATPSATPATPATPATVGTVPPLAVAVPADAVYVCAVQRDGKIQQTAIEFSPKVGELCRRHPEMGPCQYERNNCRAGGGRVFASGGVEITLQTEAEYDRKVMRTRFRAN